MTTVVRAPEQRVLLDNITWDLYESLLAAHGDRSVPRFTYDRGQLEIMSPSAEHEQIKETVTLLVNMVAEETHLNLEGFGSTTFSREDMARGFAYRFFKAHFAWRPPVALTPLAGATNW
jgi:Uma2 family endonuclease